MKTSESPASACWLCDARKLRRRAKPARVLAIYEDGTTALLCAKHASRRPAHHAVLLDLARIKTTNHADSRDNQEPVAG